MFITKDTTDADGIRNVTIQTTATGNNREGYIAAERQAHEWFFVNYDGAAILKRKHGQGPNAIVEEALQFGVLDPSWLECSHPVIGAGRMTHMFGHHLGIRPETTDGTWGFEFEILPVVKKK